MEYLTTHDIVWVNSTVTGKVNEFNYVTLEEAMASQYRYGDSTDVLGQAANFLDHLLFKPAFTEGNRRTAYIAVLTFLNANGFATKVPDADAAKIVFGTEERKLAPQEAIDALVAPAKQPLGNITLRQLIVHECNLHVEALQILSAGD